MIPLNSAPGTRNPAPQLYPLMIIVHLLQTITAPNRVKST